MCASNGLGNGSKHVTFRRNQFGLCRLETLYWYIQYFVSERMNKLEMSQMGGSNGLDNHFV